VSAPPAASALAEQWGGVAIALRERGRNALGSIVEHAMPVAASASGLLTLEVSDAASQHALEAGADEVLSVVRMLWPGVTRLALKNADDAPATPRRMTADAVRADRTVRLQRSDAVLGAAIEALDLELLD
jgi:hypothetical protein